MHYLLDTDTCISLIRHRDDVLVHRLLAERPGDVGVSTVTSAELTHGVYRSRDRDQSAQALESFLLPFFVAPFDADAAVCYGRLRAELEATGQSMGAMDLLIAAHRLALGAVLVTGNTREFSKVHGLSVGSWNSGAS